MKNSIKITIGVGIAAIVAGIIITWLYLQNEKKDKKIKELEDEIDENNNLTNEIKKQLKELIQNNKEIDPQIANELGQIAKLIEIKQDVTAILKLNKIIENLLEELYKSDKDLLKIAAENNRKTPAFTDYLQHAKNKGVITSEDFHLLSVMKIIRNEEAHEVGIKKEKSRVLAAFISGMGLVIALSQILKKKLIEPKVE